ncbi:asparagine synthase-related protein [Caulobacter sp.]|uniref:asparagine synthase-related protein n=1 Tax=Caulobacter sp. TaxID=78 RepID=UPI0031D87FDD
MTGGYLIALGPGAAELVSVSLHNRLESLGLYQAFAQKDLKIFAKGPIRVREASGLGVILGSLSPRQSSVREPVDLASLIQDHWGAYLAVLTPRDQPMGIFRDPSGAVPAFWFRTGETLVVTDQIDLAARLNLINPVIDWDTLVRDLVYKRRRGARTGLVGVTELAPGEHLAVNGLSRLAWTPWRYTTADMAFRHLDDAAEALREAVELSVRGSAADYSALSIELSGGLDSSIVAGALRDDPRLSAFNAVSRDAEGDESVFAVEVAAAMGFPLTMETLDPHLARLEPPSHELRPARPGRLGTLSPLNDALATHARQVGAQAFIGGMGGDSVFFYTNSAAPVADRLRRRGLSSGLVQTAFDVARLNNATVWSVADRAWRLALRPDLDLHRGADNAFLTCQGPIQADVHPWMAARPKGAPPGRQRHVASIAYIMGFLDGHAVRDGLAQLSPLLAQPIVETVLRTPSWFAVDRGRDRAVARRAFKDVLPGSVLRRRSKGAIDRFVYEAILANLTEIGEILAGGLLARQGLLDLPKVAEALATPEQLAGPRGQRLLALADAEYWARAWSRSD